MILFFRNLILRLTDQEEPKLKLIDYNSQPVFETISTGILDPNFDLVQKESSRKRTSFSIDFIQF